MLEIGEAVKAPPAELLDTQPAIPWRQVARTRDHLASRYFDTDHEVIQASVDEDLPELELSRAATAESSGSGKKRLLAPVRVSEL
jgi:uncharacterized protein with HEPN domain